MISISGAVVIVLYLVLGGLVFYLLWWLLDYVNPPEPWKKVGGVVLAVLGVLVLIGILLSLVDGRPVFRP